MGFVLIQTVILTIIIWLVLRGEDRPNTSGLLALPLGLSILALLSALLIGTIHFMGRLHFILVFAVSVFLLKLVFEITLKQSLLISVIWVGLMLLYPFLVDLL